MALEQAAKEVQEIMKQVDVLVLNAGRSQRSLAVETPLSIDRTLMGWEFFSPVALTKALLPACWNGKLDTSW